MRLCRHCVQVKAVAEFYPWRPSRCKACEIARVKRWKQGHPEEAVRQSRAYQRRAALKTHPGEARTCIECNRTWPRDEGFRWYTGRRCLVCWRVRSTAWGRAHPDRKRRNDLASYYRRYADPRKRETILMQGRMAYYRRKHRRQRQAAGSRPEAVA